MIGRMQIKARTVGSELARREEPEGAKSKGTAEGMRRGCLYAVVSSKLEVAARVRIVS